MKLNLIVAPLITEKGTIVSEKANQVVFRVRPEATKDKIRLVVEEHVQGHRDHRCGRQLSWAKNAGADARRAAAGLEKGLRDA